MSEPLTMKEYEILIDALGEWETSCNHNPSDLVSEALDAIFGGSMSPEQQAKLKEKIDRRMAEHDMEHRARKETSALLKAKLIQIKNALLIGEATSKLSDPRESIQIRKEAVNGHSNGSPRSDKELELLPLSR